LAIKLFGYQHSVYSWIAKLTLKEKGVDFQWSEIDPFTKPPSQSYLDLHPFNRVPTLVHDDFVLYETQAITRYIDEQFCGSILQPVEPSLRAVQNQLISIADNYAYWPMVRQVFSHQYFRPKTGMDVDENEIANGLKSANTVLNAINDWPADTAYLVDDKLSLADIHLYPMFAYFAAARDGASQLAQHPRLAQWYERVSKRRSFVETRPDILPDVSEVLF